MDIIGVFNGFEGYYVIIAWGWCFLAAIGMTIYRTCMQKNEEVQEEDILIWIIYNKPIYFTLDYLGIIKFCDSLP